MSSSWKSVKFCQRLFMYLLQWSWGFCPHSMYVVYYPNWFVDVKAFWHLWDKSYLNRVYNRFSILPIFCQRLSCLYPEILVRLFLVMFRIWFVNRIQYIHTVHCYNYVTNVTLLILKESILKEHRLRNFICIKKRVNLVCVKSQESGV